MWTPTFFSLRKIFLLTVLYHNFNDVESGGVWITLLVSNACTIMVSLWLWCQKWQVTSVCQTWTNYNNSGPNINSPSDTCIMFLCCLLTHALGLICQKWLLIFRNRPLMIGGRRNREFFFNFSVTRIFKSTKFFKHIPPYRCWLYKIIAFWKITFDCNCSPLYIYNYNQHHTVH